MLKILQARFQQYVNRELLDVQAGFEKAEEPEIKLTTAAGSWKKQESSRKTFISALLTMPKPLTVWIIINCGKLLELINEYSKVARYKINTQILTCIQIFQEAG